MSVSRSTARSGSFARYVLRSREVNVRDDPATIVADRRTLDRTRRVALAGHHPRVQLEARALPARGASFPQRRRRIAGARGGARRRARGRSGAGGRTRRLRTGAGGRPAGVADVDVRGAGRTRCRRARRSRAVHFAASDPCVAEEDARPVAQLRDEPVPATVVTEPTRASSWYGAAARTRTASSAAGSVSRVPPGGTVIGITGSPEAGTFAQQRAVAGDSDRAPAGRDRRHRDLLDHADPDPVRELGRRPAGP